MPFYVAAPYTTIDLDCFSGADICIEQRDATEVQGVAGSFGQVSWCVADTPVYNPSFDVTPGDLVTGYILDKGVFTQTELISFLRGE